MIANATRINFRFCNQDDANGNNFHSNFRSFLSVIQEAYLSHFRDQSRNIRRNLITFLNFHLFLRINGATNGRNFRSNYVRFHAKDVITRAWRRDPRRHANKATCLRRSIGARVIRRNFRLHSFLNHDRSDKRNYRSYLTIVTIASGNIRF